MYEKVIWATDGSEGANAALQEALDLVKLTGARLVVVHGDRRLTGRTTGLPVLADEEELQDRIHDQVDDLRRDGVAVDVIIRRDHRAAADIVASIATEIGGDVIVCGTRGLGMLSRAVFGSFTQRLLHVAPCPVLAVPDHNVVDASQVKQGGTIGVGG